MDIKTKFTEKLNKEWKMQNETKKVIQFALNSSGGNDFSKTDMTEVWELFSCDMNFYALLGAE